MGSTASFHMKEGLGHYMSPRLQEKYPGIMFSQFMGAEMIVKKHGFTRAQLDQFAYESHMRAVAATQAGVFGAEIIGLEVETPEGTEMHLTDEGIRYDATPESIGSVKLLQEGGSISAANASQICDGASAVLIVSEAALKAHGLTPLARIHNVTVTAGDPVIMLEEPLFATDRALKRAGMTIGDIDLYEVNEAFAPVPLAWLKHTGADPTKLNVNGGAIALGHGDIGPCAESTWRAVWPADDVRRRRRCQCDDYRTVVVFRLPELSEGPYRAQRDQALHNLASLGRASRSARRCGYEI
jgi:acetyl-CoA C-acetyltransferase